MMGSSVMLWATVALATLSMGRSVCDDIAKYFGDVDSVSEIDLGSVTTVECPPDDEGDMVREIVIESGKSLTIKSTQSYVQFVNVRFTVNEGATLKFDMPATRIGPNPLNWRDASGHIFDVNHDASLTFTGTFTASQVENAFSMFGNSGTIEFKDDALFDSNGNVFRSNVGTLKFRGDTVFKNNDFIALENEGPDAYVRFSKTVIFDDNAAAFEGTPGCAIDNEGTAIFRDDAEFLNHKCYDGATVANSGKMRFYGKASIVNNDSFDGDGGLTNEGDLIFKDAAQFTGNTGRFSGALHATGGELTFKKAVTFDSNGSDTTGGAFVLTGDALVTFREPDAVQTSGNYIIDGDEPVTGCSLGYVEEGATLVGFDVDDVCVEVTVE